MKRSLVRALSEACDRGLLRRLEKNARAAEAELRQAQRDARLARRTLADDDRWALAQAYYAVFHALNGFLMQHGHRERGHAALGRVAVEYLAPAGVLAPSDAQAFAQLRVWRERAMYELESSHAQAEAAVELAERIIKTLVLPLLEGR